MNLRTISINPDGGYNIITNKTFDNETPENTSILTAISNLNKTLNERIDSIENNYSNQLHEINAIARGRSNYRGNTNRFGNNKRFNFNDNKGMSSNWRNNNTSRINEPSQGNFRCFKCNGQNHYARDCRSKNM